MKAYAILFLVILQLMDAKHAVAQTETDPDKSHKVLKKVILAEHRAHTSKRNEFFNIMSGESEGLLTARQYFHYKKKKPFCEFEALDNRGKKMWLIKAQVNADIQFLKGSYARNKYTILLKKKKVFSNKSLFTLWNIDIPTGTLTEQVLNILYPIKISHFETVGNKSIIAGKTEKENIILIHDYTSSQTKTVTVSNIKTNQLLNITKSEVDSTFLIIEKVDKKIISLRRLNNDGKQVDRKTIYQKNTRSATIVSPYPGKQYLVGNYTKGRSNKTAGVFIKDITKRNSASSLYPVSSLGNFGKYLYYDLDKKIKKQHEKQQPLKSKKRKRHHLMIAETLLFPDSSFCVVLEGYKIRYDETNKLNYRISAYYDQAPKNKNPFSKSYENKAYIHTHNVLLKFDKNGKLLWDQSTPLEQRRRLSLSQVSQSLIKKNSDIVISSLVGVKLKYHTVSKEGALINQGTLTVGRTNGIVKWNDTDLILPIYKRAMGVKFSVAKVSLID